MSLDDYKKLKVTQIDYFFRGINFENIGKDGRDFPLVDKNLVVQDEQFDLEYINAKKSCRRFVLPFLKDLVSFAYEFMTTDMEFAGSVAAVDMAVNKFVVNVMKSFEKFKEEFLDDYHNSLNGTIKFLFKIPELNGFSIKIGDNVFPWFNRNSSSLEGATDVVDDARVIMHWIYILPLMEKEFYAKREELRSLLLKISEYFERGTPAYRILMANYTKIVMAKDDVDGMVRLFNNTLHEIEKVAGINLEGLKEPVVGLNDPPKRSR